MSLENEPKFTHKSDGGDEDTPVLEQSAEVVSNLEASAEQTPADKGRAYINKLYRKSELFGYLSLTQMMIAVPSSLIAYASTSPDQAEKAYFVYGLSALAAAGSLVTGMISKKAEKDAGKLVDMEGRS